MNRQKWLILVVVLAGIGGTAGGLTRLKAHQRLGNPGVKWESIPGSVRVKIDLPEHVLDFDSEPVEEDKTVVDMLPPDTSYAQRRYTAPDGSGVVVANVVLMGVDRTSIHKPEFCLPGQGWRIDEKSRVTIPLAGPVPGELPVMKWTLTNYGQTPDGRKQEFRGLYVFWFVAEDEQTADHYQRMWWLARDLLRTGVLQRWACVTYFSVCLPGEEEAAFERMKKLMAASVPEFQLAPKARETVAVARP